MRFISVILKIRQKISINFVISLYLKVHQAS